MKEVIVTELYCPPIPITEMICHEPAFVGDSGEDVVEYAVELRTSIRTCQKQMDTIRETLDKVGAP